MQIPNTEAETPEHKTLNNALVTINEALSTRWKLSVSHGPLTYAKGLKMENQDTRWALGTLSWVYNPSDYLMVIGSWLSLLVIPVARPTAS